MKNLIITLLAILSLTSVLAQDYSVKDKIVNSFNNFEGTVTQESIDTLFSNLKDLSSEQPMCFNTLGVYNNCDDYADSIFIKAMVYIDDLIGKNVEVKLTKWNKPWDDENFYTLRFEIYYENTNPNFPTNLNFDTFIIDVNNNKIQNVILAREWIDLDKFGM